MRCCTLSLSVESIISHDNSSHRAQDSHALMMVCSLMTISVVSAFGRDTRAAMAAASVSRMILGVSEDH